MGIKGRHNKIKYFLLDTVNALFEKGKGKSKHQAMQESYEKNRTREVDAIFSYSTKVRYEKAVAKLADFLRDEMGIKYEKDFRQLSVDEVYVCLDKYFEREKSRGLSQNTLEIHISAFDKILGAINEELRGCFDPDSRAKWRDGQLVGYNDRYDKSDEIIENLKKLDETSAAIAELQRTVGCRIGDVKKLTIDEENMAVHIEGSKGGRDRIIHFDRFEEDFNKVKECKEILDRALKEKSFSEIREDEYYKNLRKACRKVGEIYRGSHPFRYEFAQDRFNEISRWEKEEQEAYYRRILEERRKSDKEIEKAVEYVREKDVIDVAIISEELGHSRLDISMHYLKIRRK